MGREVNTELVNSNLPAWLRKVDVMISLLSHRDTSGVKSSAFVFVNPSGKPKYVNGRVPVEQPKD